MKKTIIEPILSYFENKNRRNTFHEIYKKGLWGRSEKEKFFSGQGSRGLAAETYAEKISSIINSTSTTGAHTLSVVDLGCGDFEVGKKLMSKIKNISYIGCDIVPELIKSHQTHTKDVYQAKFFHIDIVSDELPDGDVCLIRQVFQHLSNNDILKVIPKLVKYKKVYVSESYPIMQIGAPNPDKPTDHEVRFDWRTGCGRGVELDKEPFCLRIKELFRVSGGEKEVIVTFLVNPSKE